MRVLFFLAAFILAMAPTAQAASFDCAKAKSTFERAICDNPDLSRADEVMAKAYSTALGGLTDAAAGTVKQGQKAWLDFANRACTKEAEPDAEAYDEDGINCLQTIFSARISILEGSRMLGGLRFYPVSAYAALRDPDGEDPWTVAKKALSSPRIDGEDGLAEAFNAELEGLLRERMGGAGAGDDPGTDNDEELVVTAANSERITVRWLSSMYGHGAAHGNYTISYLHFLRTPMRALQASDIFAGSGWEQKLADLALERLTADLGDALMLDDPSSLADLVVDPARWDFSPAGLVLQFQPYEVAPYAAGAPTVAIPWTALDAELAPEAYSYAVY